MPPVIEQRHQGSRPQFTLRTGFVGMFLLALPLAWWSHSAQRQKQAVAMLRASGCSVGYESEHSRSWTLVPAPLRSGNGANFFDNVIQVKNNEPQAGAAKSIVRALGALSHLKTLELWLPEITNDDFRTLGTLENLEYLRVEDAQVNDSALVALRTLRQLRVLRINGRGNFSADGISALSHLPMLTELELAGDKLSPSALAAIGELHQVRQLSLQVSWSQNPYGITDKELACLSGMTNLECLNLRGSIVTREGLRHLKGLKNLKLLELSRGPDPNRCDELRNALPRWVIKES